MEVSNKQLWWAAGVVSVGIVVLVISLYSRKPETTPVKTPVAPPTTATPEISETAKMKELLVGTWQSIDDPESVIVFLLNGTLEDRYSGEVVDHATWLITGPSTLTQTMSDGTVLYYSFELIGDDLELTYLSRGGILSYKRIPTAATATDGQPLVY